MGRAIMYVKSAVWLWTIACVPRRCEGTGAPHLLLLYASRDLVVVGIVEDVEGVDAGEQNVHDHSKAPSIR